MNENLINIYRMLPISDLEKLSCASNPEATLALGEKYFEQGKSYLADSCIDEAKEILKKGMVLGNGECALCLAKFYEQNTTSIKDQMLMEQYYLKAASLNDLEALKLMILKNEFISELAELEADDYKRKYADGLYPDLIIPNEVETDEKPNQVDLEEEISEEKNDTQVEIDDSLDDIEFEENDKELEENNDSTHELIEEIFETEPETDEDSSKEDEISLVEVETFDEEVMEENKDVSEDEVIEETEVFEKEIDNQTVEVVSTYNDSSESEVATETLKTKREIDELCAVIDNKIDEFDDLPNPSIQYSEYKNICGMIDSLPHEYQGRFQRFRRRKKEVEKNKKEYDASADLRHEFEKKNKDEKLREYIEYHLENYVGRTVYLNEGTGKTVTGTIIRNNSETEYAKRLITIDFGKYRGIKKYIQGAIDDKTLSFNDIFTRKDESLWTDSERELYKEQDHYLEISKYCEENSFKEYEEKDIQYRLPGDKETRQEADFIGFANAQKTATERSKWRNIWDHPFFASVETKEGGKFYIGEDGFKNENTNEEIIGWTDPKAAYYYQWKFMVDDPEKGIEVVRNHKLTQRTYVDFVDLVNKINPNLKELADMVGDNSDSYLTQMLEESRSDNSTHDIIKTIQQEQYGIISSINDKNIVVNGCCGSGKTMILFHKIAYNMFNDENAKTSDICVLSSNQLLNKEANVLAEILKINSIKNTDTQSFYVEFLNKLIKDNTTELVINNVIPSDKYPDLYNETILKQLGDATIKNLETSKDVAFINRCINYVTPKISNLVKMREAAITNTFKKYRKYSKAIEQDNVLCSFLREQKNNKLEKLKESFEFLKNISAVNLRAVIDRSDRIKEGAREQLQILFNLFHEYMNGQTRRNEKTHELYLDMNSLPNISYFNKKANEFLDRKRPEKTLSRVNDGLIAPDYIIDLYDYIHLENATKNILSIISDNDKKSGALLAANFAICNAIKKEFKMFYKTIELPVVFALIYIYTYLQAYDYEKNMYKQIYIDEFQNYSIAEINLLKRLNSNAQFALFGDVKQKIDSKGIQNINAIPLDFKSYELNTNYRNAKEICEVINKRFGTTMRPIGVSGTVQYMKPTSAIYECEENKRTAIILKDVTSIDFNEEYNYLSGIDDSFVEKNKINILSVDDAKGLEFEKVYVVTNGMNENEQYVAMSRALSNLIIVE